MLKYLFFALVCFLSISPLKNFSNYVLNERDNRPVKYVIQMPDGSTQQAPENIHTDSLITRAHLSEFLAPICQLLTGIFLILFLIKFINRLNQKQTETEPTDPPNTAR